MNKRLIKKMSAKKQAFEGSVYAYGNNGADILDISNLEEGMVYLGVGSCCVMTLEKAVPVEFVTGLISKAMLDHNGDINSIIDSFGWEQSYKDELKEKVRDYR